MHILIISTTSAADARSSEDSTSAKRFTQADRSSRVKTYIGQMRDTYLRLSQLHAAGGGDSTEAVFFLEVEERTANLRWSQTAQHLTRVSS